MMRRSNMMRKDIYEGVQIYVNQNIKPNYAELARQFGSDYRTVKNAYEKSFKKKSSIKISDLKRKRPSVNSGIKM
jgi:hypothetical protein